MLLFIKIQRISPPSPCLFLFLYFIFPTSTPSRIVLFLFESNSKKTFRAGEINRNTLFYFYNGQEYCIVFAALAVCTCAEPTALFKNPPKDEAELSSMLASVEEIAKQAKNMCPAKKNARACKKLSKPVKGGAKGEPLRVGWSVQTFAESIRRLLR